jgi:hypothetical protein
MKVYQVRNDIVHEKIICLPIPPVVWLGGETFSLSRSMYMGLVTLSRQKYTTEPLVLEPITIEVEMATEKLK